MYVTSLISSTPLGFTALGTSFSMRNDLPIKLGLISKDKLDYAKKGSKIMIKYKWMEQPPQMKDRNKHPRGAFHLILSILAEYFNNSSFTSLSFISEIPVSL
ncbi:DUF3231 family protein [Clostridium sp.]|uniref:DUF3231 family protein n=1 Tax=Clostridium sp. TaxID=1506 RepID=UPI003D6CDD56